MAEKTRSEKYETEEERVQENEESSNWKKKIVIVLSFILIFIFSGIYYSRYIATTGLIIKEYKVSNEMIPSSFYGTKIIHISDLHYKTTVFKKDIEDMVNKINELNADIIVLTGDLFDSDTVYSNQDFEELSKSLSKLDANIGKFAITGNHDIKFTEWETTIKKSGFINLNDQYTLLYNKSLHPILIAGVSSNLKNRSEISKRMESTTKYLSSIKGKEKNNNIPSYKILLIHEPDYIDDIDSEQFQLILAGHSHNGQIRIPKMGAIVLPVGAKKYYKEYYSLNNTDLYISSGVGTSTIPYRLFNKPSINLYRLVNN